MKQIKLNDNFIGVLLAVVLLFPISVKIPFFTELIIGLFGLLCCVLFNRLRFSLPILIYVIMILVDIVSLYLEANFSFFSNFNILSIGDKLVLLIWAILATSLITDISKTMQTLFSISLPFVFVFTVSQILNFNWALSLTYNFYNTSWEIVNFYHLIGKIQRGLGPFEHPSSLGLYSFLALVFLEGKNRENRNLLYSLLIVMAITTGILSFSKTFLILFMLWLYTRIVEDKSLLRRIIIGLGIIIFIPLIVNYNNQHKDVYNPLQENMLSAFSIEGLFGTRFDSSEGLLAPLIRKIPQLEVRKIIFGNGSTQTDIFIGDSQYLVTFFQNGVMGLTILLILLIISFLGFYKIKNMKLLVICIAFTGIGFVFFIAPRITVVIVVLLTYGMNLFMKRNSKVTTREREL
jgi:hypothetical protein